MMCPKCKNLETKVIDSRITDEGGAIRRRRECDVCNARFTTFERMEFVSFFVNKKTGEKELYDRSKLERSILKSFNKRKVAQSKIEEMLNSLEIEWAMNKKEITSKRIGKDVLHKLVDLDQVAAVRFASVYGNFESPDDFKKFISEEFE